MKHTCTTNEGSPACSGCVDGQAILVSRLEPPMAMRENEAWCLHVDELLARSARLAVERGHLRR